MYMHSRKPTLQRGDGEYNTILYYINGCLCCNGIFLKKIPGKLAKALC